MSEVKTNKISPSSGTTLTLGNSGDNVTGAGGLASVQVFTTLGSQTWTRPTGVTRVMVEVQGAGGSGGKETLTAPQWVAAVVVDTLENL